MQMQCTHCIESGVQDGKFGMCRVVRIRMRKRGGMLMKLEWLEVEARILPSRTAREESMPAIEEEKACKESCT